MYGRVNPGTRQPGTAVWSEDTPHFSHASRLTIIAKKPSDFAILRFLPGKGSSKNLISTQHPITI